MIIGLAALAGIGFGTLSGPLGPIVVSDVDRTLADSATLRTAQQIVGALGIALVGTAYFSVGGADAAAQRPAFCPGQELSPCSLPLRS